MKILGNHVITQRAATIRERKSTQYIFQRASIRDQLARGLTLKEKYFCIGK